MKPEITGTSSEAYLGGKTDGWTLGPEVYRENIFRLAEVGVEATEREFSRRLQMLEAAEKAGLTPPPGSGRAFPPEPAVDSRYLREIIQRLGTDPERRILDELLWFWPQQPGGARQDEALQALQRGDTDGAIRLWSEQEKTPATRVVATHNLAVAAHLQALELEQDGADPAKARARDGHWREAQKRWKPVVESEAVWSRLNDRVRQINDARLRTSLGRRLQDWLPRGLLQINARLAAQHGEAGRPAELKRQLALMRGLGFPADTLDEILQEVARPVRERIGHLCRNTNSEVVRQPVAGLPAIQRLVEQTRGPIALLDQILGESDATRRGARDAVGEQIRSSLVEYLNATEDWETAIPLCEEALRLAVNHTQRENIEKNLDSWREMAKELNRWHGAGYWTLPADVVEELERGHTQMETENRLDEPISIVAGVLAGRGKSAVPVPLRPTVERTLAYALNRRAVRILNPAISVYNEDPPTLIKVKERIKSGRVSPLELMMAGMASQPGASPHCMACGGGIYGSYYTRPLGGLKIIVCTSCNGDIKSEIEEQGRVLESAMSGPLEDTILAAELNPQSTQLRENLESVKKRASGLSMAVPRDGSRLRLALGFGDLETALRAQQSRDSKLAAAGREWISHMPVSALEDLPKLERVLKQAEPEACAAAVKAIGDLGQAARPALPILIPMLLRGPAPVRLALPAALDRIDSGWRTHPAAVALVAECRSGLGLSGKPAVASAAGGDLPPVIGRSGASSGDTNLAVVDALVCLGAENPAAVLALSDAVEDRDPRVVSAAVHAFVRLRNSKCRTEIDAAVPRMIRAFANAQADLAKALVAALSALKPGAWAGLPEMGTVIASLVAILRGGNKTEARRAAAVLEILAEHCAVVNAGDIDIALALLRTDSTRLQTAGRNVLVALRGDNALAHLVSVLDDSAEAVRFAVVAAISGMGESARPVWTRMLDRLLDEASTVRRAALSALPRIIPGWRTERAIGPVLIAQVSRLGEATRSDADRADTGNILLAISEENPAVVQSLLDVLTKGELSARRPAAALLGRLDRDRNRSAVETALPALLGTLSSITSEIADALLQALTALKIGWDQHPLLTGLVDTLIGQLTSPDASVRANASGVLSLLCRHSPGLCEKLAGIAAGGDDPAAIAALECLGSVGKEAGGVAPILAPVLLHQFAGRRQAARAAMDKIAPGWQGADCAKALVPELAARLKKRLFVWEKWVEDLLGSIAPSELARVRLRRKRLLWLWSGAAACLLLAIGIVAWNLHAATPEYQYALGLRLLDDKDLDSAACFGRAAAKGHALAANQLGHMYDDGGMAKADPAAAARWYRQALAAKGGPGPLDANARAAAEAGLGCILLDTSSAEPDLQEAVRLLRAAADQGDSRAQFALARAMAMGRGMPRDIAGAFKWFDSASVTQGVPAEAILKAVGDICGNSRDKLIALVETETDPKVVAIVSKFAENFHGAAIANLPGETHAGQNLNLSLGNGGPAIDMIWIAPGHFSLGAQSVNDDEQPLTEVTLTKGYWLGKTEVTQAQWEALMEGNPSNFKGPDRPVENVSWDDAMEYCRKLTERERSAGRLPDGYEYTLPTEAQWEYACRAGTTGDYSGTGNLDDMGWYMDNSESQTHPVGQKRPNTWGLYDMHGNVSEWCRDWKGGYPGGTVTDPIGPPSGSDRVYRGGCWSGVAAYCRSARRDWCGPGLRDYGLGFRLALAPQVSPDGVSSSQASGVRGDGQALSRSEGRPGAEGGASPKVSERERLRFVGSLLKGHSPAIRRAALERLLAANDPAVAPTVAAEYNVVEPGLRAQIVKTIRRVFNDDVSQIADMMKAGDQTSAFACGLDVLKDVLRDGSESVRSAAVDLLAGLPNFGGLPALREAVARGGSGSEVAVRAVRDLDWRKADQERRAVEIAEEKRMAGAFVAQMSGNSESLGYQVPANGPGMVWIAPGTFAMGSETGDVDEKPVTQVTLTNGYWLGKTEVTQAQWQTVIAGNPSFSKGEDKPVETISWDDAMEYCRKLTERECSAGRLPDGYEYTLPTEAQWEYACRAGTTGDVAVELDAMGWYADNSGNATHSVAQKQPNAWGLYDMHGNVWEWCRDWHGNYQGGSVTDPTGPYSGSLRVGRSGAWGSTTRDCRFASRNRLVPGWRRNNLGFRLALAKQDLFLSSEERAQCKRVAEQEQARRAEEAEETRQRAAQQAEGFRQDEQKPVERSRLEAFVTDQGGNAETLGFRIGQNGPEMIGIPPGSFAMGNAIGGKDERPVTHVAISQPFWIEKTEVTQSQWEALMEGNPSEKKGVDLPVDTVSWEDAMKYCRKLTERERATGRLPEGYEYTLPTEAQWEYACRAGMTGEYTEDDVDAMAWHGNNSRDGTNPVGQRKPNAWGLYDMLGNVLEWCRDWYGAYPGGSVTDPMGPLSGTLRVVRGGEYSDWPRNYGSARRFNYGPGTAEKSLGFRIALSRNRKPALSPGGVRVATAARKQLFAHHSTYITVITVLTTIDQGKTLISASGDNTISLWSLADGRLLATLGELARPGGDGIHKLAITPDEAIMVTGTTDGEILMWSLSQRTLLSKLEAEDYAAGLQELAITPDGRFLISKRKHEKAKIWSLPEGRPVASFGKPEDYLAKVCFPPGGKMLVCACLKENGIGFERYSLPGGRLLGSIENGECNGATVYCTPGGLAIGEGMKSGPHQLWNLADGKPIEALYDNDKKCFSVRLVADGRLIVSRIGNSILRCRDGTDGGGPVTVVLEGLSDDDLGEGGAETLSPAGDMIAIGGGNAAKESIRVWSTRDGRLLASFQGAGILGISRIQFSPDGKTLVAASDDGSISLWDLETFSFKCFLGTPKDE